MLGIFYIQKKLIKFNQLLSFCFSETYKPKHKVSDEVVLKLYANDASHADKIKKDLIQNFKNKFATYKMEEKKIKQLSPEQVHLIQCS